MARWLRDADTGELFREDELDPSSYEPLTDFQDVAPREPQTQFPSWLTSGIGTSVPARSLASIAKSGASLEQMLGDLASNIPGLENNALQRDALLNRRMAEDLVNQARQENKVEPGSWQDIGGAVAGELIPSLGTLGYGLARAVGKGALSMLPAVFPSATKYGDLTEQGVGGGEAGLAALGSFGMNSLLNRFDVGAALNPAVSTAKRVGQTALTGGATNAVGTYGDALIDKAVGAPQTRDQFINNLLSSAATGAATGAGFGAMASLKPSLDVQAPEGQSTADLLARMEQDTPKVVSEPLPPKSSLVSDADIPLIEAAPPEPRPLVQVEDVYRARDLAGRQREIDDLFFPEDSELSYLRQSDPTSTSQVIDIQKMSPSGAKIIGNLDEGTPLTPLERQVADQVSARSKSRIADERISENEATLRELLAKRSETRNSGSRSSSTPDSELLLKVDESSESFPQPIIKSVSEASAKQASNITLPPGVESSTSPLPLSLVPDRLKPAPPPSPQLEQVDVYQSRGPAETFRYDPLSEQVANLTRGSSSGLTDSELPIIGQEPLQNQAPELVTPESLGSKPGELWVDPTSDIGVRREAAKRLVNGQRTTSPTIISAENVNPPKTDGPSITPVEVYNARVTEDKVAQVKPKGTQPNDLPNALGKRRATRTKKQVTRSESGHMRIDQFPLIGDAIDLVRWMRDRKDKTGGGVNGYQDWSPTNKRYEEGTWGRLWEWMDTTRRKEPASAAFIDGQWRIPQDTHAIVWDADETLAPYKNPDLTPKERQGVNNYLQAARVLGSREKGYTVSAETAAKAGLNQKQIDAALAVKRWSNFFADIFENDSLAQAEHYAQMESIKAPNDEYRAKIAKTLEETKAKIAETFKGWRDSNYVPFDRYGEHYINVISPDGKLLARQQFESKNDPAFKKAVAHYQQLATQSGEYAGAKVQYGRQAPSKLLQYDGISKDILDYLGEDPSSDPINGFSRHLKTPRMIDGKLALVPGQNADVGRAIADYTVGAARLLAFRRANRVADIELATSLAGDDKINLRNKLIEFKDSLNKPTGGFSKALNEYFNAAYIGGNARVPIADQLGFFQMQTMVLSKYLKGIDPERIEFKTYGNLAKYYFGRGIDADMSVGIKEAQRKGLIPTDTFKTYLRARRGPSDVMQAMSTVKDAYFSLKSLSERTVDAGAFMSGWEAWKKLPAETKKTISQQQFAENMIREMKAVPSQSELPPNALFKSPVGRLATKFRLYQVKLAKTIGETPMPGKLRGALRTFLTVGVSGLPLVKEAFNLSRGLGVEPEDKLREMGAGAATMYGPFSALTGVDFSGTAGFGEVFPSQAENPFSKLALGMIGAPFEAGLKALQYAERGQGKKALAQIPVSNLLSNYLNQSDWADRGVVTMGGQAVIPRDDVRGVDRLKKLAGLQPLAVKEAMVKENRFKQAEAKARDNDFINQRLGEALGLGKTEDARAVIREAREKGLQFNMQSVKKAIGKIRGQRPSSPKRAREEVAQIDRIYGGALRD